MPKHANKKPHQPGVGAELVGTSEELISSLIADDENREWAVSEVVNEGPEHKQVFSALLLSRMYKLVQQLEKETGASFTAQKGIAFQSAKEGWDMPIEIPASSLKKENRDAVVDAISHSPSHELVAFSALLQAIEWSIAATKKAHAV